MHADLLEQWHDLARAGFNNRAVAARLGISEAQLVASACGAHSVRLVPDAAAILEAAKRLRTVKWVVRNDFAVLERRGAVAAIDPGPDGLFRVDTGTALLSLAAGNIASAFALTEPRGQNAKCSLQLFDASGVSAVKLVAAVPAAEFGAVVNSLSHPRQSQHETVELSAPRQTVQQRVEPGALSAFLHGASELGTPLDLQVGNSAAAIEVRSPMRRIKRSDHAPWINVLDPDLEIHLHEARIRGFALERETLHWYSETGEEVFSAGCGAHWEPLARAARGHEAVVNPC